MVEQKINPIPENALANFSFCIFNYFRCRHELSRVLNRTSVSWSRGRRGISREHSVDFGESVYHFFRQGSLKSDPLLFLTEKRSVSG